MSEEFDGYRKWLGIPPEDQPPNHYRLLGIAAFEDDPDVISNAADRQMAHVRTFQSGKNGELSQKILTELSAAKVCLLSDEKKKAYDVQLRKELAAKKSRKSGGGGKSSPATPPPPGKPKPVPPPPKNEGATPVAPVSVGASSPAVSIATAPTIPVPIADETSSVGSPVSVGIPTRSAATSRTRRRKKSPVPLALVAVGVIGLAAIAGIAGLILSSNVDDSSGIELEVPGTFPPAASDDDADRRKERSNTRTGNSPIRPRNRTDRGDGRLGRLGSSAGDKDDKDPVFGNLPEADTTKREQLAKAIGDTRAALAQRDVNAATSSIGIVDSLKPRNRQVEEAERIRTLFDLYTDFWRGVYNGVETLSAGDELGVGNQKAEFVGFDEDQITLRDRGEKRTQSLKRLKVVYLVALARLGMDESDPQSKYRIAAFLALDQNRNDQLQKYAVNLYKQASQGGVANAHLATELGIDADEVALGGLPDPTTSDPEPGVDEPGSSPPSPATRPSIPSSDDLREARLKVTQQFRAKFASARTSDEQRELVAELIRAAQTERNPATQYALWEKTRDVTVEIANPQAVVASIDAMANSFDIDELQEKAIYLGKTLSKANDDEVINSIASLSIELKDEAKEAGKIGAAVQLAQVAKAAGLKVGNVDVIREAETEIKRLDVYVKEQSKVERALERLEADADDPIANYAVGKFTCFYDSNWKRGLPMLAKGSNDQLSELAQRELAETKSAVEYKELGDAWLGYARREDPLATANILAHAGDLYRKALPGLEGEQREAVGDRLRELGGNLLD